MIKTRPNPPHRILFDAGPSWILQLSVMPYELILTRFIRKLNSGQQCLWTTAYGTPRRHRQPKLGLRIPLCPEHSWIWVVENGISVFRLQPEHDARQGRHAPWLTCREI
jgi:hypothetical protein